MDKLVAFKLDSILFLTKINCFNFLNMKFAYLIRHGKSSWDHPDLSDMDRPLKKRGIKDGTLMGQIISKAGIKPDLLISSPANRAYSTAMIIAREIGYPEEAIVKDQEIYFNGAESILEVIRKTNNSLNTIIVFGHNPDFTSLANKFSEEYINNLPTTGVAGVEFNIDDWKQASSTNGKLILLDFPSRHKF